MTIKLLVGNISTEANEDLIRNLFSATAGPVNSVDIPQNPKTGKNRGYALVEMNTDLDAEQAVRDLDGAELGGRVMAISVVERTQTKRKWYKFWVKC
jgi:RNA recognition motif-containing protein